MHRFIVCAVFLILCTSAGRGDQNHADTRLLSQPAVSASQVAFIYADDLFVCDLDGRNVRRLTSDQCIESNPVFAPDGKTIAFSAQYEGNTDVYTIPSEGGAPTRLTWHPGPDLVRGFTPDGKAVLFSSPRHVFTNRYTQLFTVPVTAAALPKGERGAKGAALGKDTRREGSMPTQLPIPNRVEACYS